MMKMRAAAASLWTVGLLAACGGGSGGQVQEGMLHGGGFQGVAYRTATQSGTTNASGRFQYREGETVTFSVGAITLGSAAGSPGISFLDLAKAEVPADELTLRSELNRMRTTATPLSRAVNIHWLMLALDVDGNPLNGVDVRGRDSELREAKVDFGVLLTQFPGQLAGLAPRLNTAIPAGRPVAHLFRTLGLRMAAGVPARRNFDADGDGVDDARLTVTFDAAGAVRTTALDRAVDGDADAITQFQRGAFGRLTAQHTEDDRDGDGQTDYSRQLAVEFDDRGNVVLVTERESGDYPPVDHSDLRQSARYDEFGRVLEETHESRDPQGGLLSRDRFVYTRDVRGNLLTLTAEYDDGGDGVVDFRTRRTSEYDAGNRLVHSDDVQDVDNDGAADWRQLSEYGYDNAGRLSELRQSTDFDGNGDFDHVSVQNQWFDAAGNVERVRTHVQDARGGDHDGLHEYLFTYDGDRRQLTQVNLIDLRADGVLDERVEATDDYDTHGMKRGREVSWTDLRTGALIRSSRATLQYDPRGAQVGETLSWDLNGDGVAELREALRVEYDPSEDALGQIVDEYFPF